MKRGTVAFVMIFCVAILFVSSVNAEKPPKPECILFWGDLESAGNTIIDGCCPNAGPAPEYTMTMDICYESTVTGPTCVGEVPLHGYVFMNVLGTPGPDQQYMVKFWTWDYGAGDPAFGDYFFEIRGGVMEGGGKKDGTPSTVTYTNDTATLWVYYDRNINCSFSDYFSEPPGCSPCYDVVPGCDPTSDDPNCYDPCNEEFSIENVSFVRLRSPDLSYCSGSGNIPPTASFTSNCSGLDCGFTDTSTDGDGSVVGWSWDFGDGGTSTEQNLSYSYAAAGTYTVILTVTDDGGETDDTSQPVTVTEPGTGITLTATGYKVKGRQKADLEWSDATPGAVVDVYRDGTPITTTDDDGFYIDHIDNRGGGSYIYQVCEEGTTTCSNEATVVF
jgi:PKD repeat protein